MNQRHMLKTNWAGENGTTAILTLSKNTQYFASKDVNSSDLFPQLQLHKLCICNNIYRPFFI